MHCGVMVTGYNQGDWERLLAGDYSRPPAVSDETRQGARDESRGPRASASSSAPRGDFQPLLSVTRRGGRNDDGRPPRGSRPPCRAACRIRRCWGCVWWTLKNCAIA